MILFNGSVAPSGEKLVPTSKGRVLIAADVFWWVEGEDQKIDLDKHDDFASDQEQLRLSRSHALQLSDYIIPCGFSPLILPPAQKKFLIGKMY